MIVSVNTTSRRRQKKALRCRAFLNDVEVTNECYYADDRAGIVRCFQRSPARGGSFFVAIRNNAFSQVHDVAKVERRGRVRIERQR